MQSALYKNTCPWPRGLRRRSAAVRLLRFRDRIPPGAWMSVSSALSRRGLRDGPIPRPEESYRVCVSLSVIKCNNSPLHLQLVDRGQTKKERKKERKKESNTRFLWKISSLNTYLFILVCTFILPFILYITVFFLVSKTFLHFSFCSLVINMTYVFQPLFYHLH